MAIEYTLLLAEDSGFEVFVSHLSDAIKFSKDLVLRDSGELEGPG